MAGNVADFTTHSIEEGPGPGKVVPCSPSSHAQPRSEMMKLSEPCAQNGSIATTDNECIVQAMVLEHVSATRPGKTG